MITTKKHCHSIRALRGAMLGVQGQINIMEFGCPEGGGDGKLCENCQKNYDMLKDMNEDVEGAIRCLLTDADVSNT